MENKKLLIKTEKLRQVFVNGDVEQVVLNDIDSEIYEGDFTIIMGASGSGKSTLLYAISGMRSATGGHIYFCDEDITTKTSDQLAVFRKNNCGFVFQEKCLIESLSGMDNVLVSGLAVTEDKNSIINTARALFDKVDITPDLQNKLPSEMSGGIQQRVAIVRALINSPKVLFADEPTGALNSDSSTKVMDIFNQFNNEGQSIIMVTHDMNCACRGNRILYFKDGIMVGELLLDKYTGPDEARTEKVREFLKTMGW